jgi:hypothetical protein
LGLRKHCSITYPADTLNSFLSNSQQEESDEKISRRDFLKIARATAASVALSASTPATQVPAATVVSAFPRIPFTSVKENL